METNLTEIAVRIQHYLRKKKLTLPSAKWQPFYLGPNVLTKDVSVINANTSPEVNLISCTDVRYWLLPSLLSFKIVSQQTNIGSDMTPC